MDLILSFPNGANTFIDMNKGDRHKDIREEPKNTEIVYNNE